jgi:hypothetical protein
MSEEKVLSPEIFNIQKMLFIYNALKDGWSVKMVDNNVFEFQKDKKNQKFNLDNYVNNFIIKNMDLSNE